MRRSSFLKLIGLTPIAFSMNPLKSLERLTEHMPLSETMPVLFLGHGSPMNAIEENQFVAGFRKAAQQIPTPQAILCISAHWYTRGTKVTAMEMPKTIHDFGGFPQALFDVQYPAPGSPDLAEFTQEILAPTSVELDESWGLDHGAWSVIKHMYPDANIPVVQLSIDYTQPASFHFELAQRLQSLRQKGILIIGSGNIVHNLRMVDFNNFNTVGYAYDWAQEAHQVINDRLLNGNFKELMDYQKLGKAVQLAVPTPDHYLPMIYSLGLKSEKEDLSLFNDELLAGSISMTSFRIG